MWRKIRLKLILWILTPLSLLLRLYAKTLRWKNGDLVERNPNSIFAILHGQALIMILFGRDKGIYSLSSLSEDGLIAGKLQELMGFNVIYGSTEMGRSRRGARSGTLKLIKALRSGFSAGITVDGPLGPLLKVQKGVIYLSQKTGKPIIPTVARPTKAYVFNSWDRFTIPLPFSEVEILEGKPFFVKPGDDIDQKALELEQILRRLYERGMQPFLREIPKPSEQTQT